jgi:hypothetical protein
VNIEDRLARLRPLAETPGRTAMPRSERFPSMAAQHLRSEQEIVALRSALREAIGIIEELRTTSEPPSADPRLVRFYPRGTP